MAAHANLELDPAAHATAAGANSFREHLSRNRVASSQIAEQSLKLQAMLQIVCDWLFLNCSQAVYMKDGAKKRAENRRKGQLREKMISVCFV